MSDRQFSIRVHLKPSFPVKTATSFATSGMTDGYLLYEVTEFVPDDAAQVSAM